MPWYGKIVDGVLVQKQGKNEAGFIEIPDDAVCGMLYNGSVFTNPPPTPQTPSYPTSIIMQDAVTGEPVKVVVKNGETYVQRKQE